MFYMKNKLNFKKIRVFFKKMMFCSDRRPFKDAVIDLASVLQSIGVRAFLMGMFFMHVYIPNT